MADARIADVRTQKGATPDMDKVKAAAEAFAREMEQEEATVKFDRPPERIFRYAPPEKSKAFEPLIRPICERINQSGWLWTVESCEGHDETNPRSHGWNFPDPLLRLACRSEHMGHLILLLKRATGDQQKVLPVIFPGYRPDEEWCEVITYMQGSAPLTDRRKAYAELAELAHTNPPK